MEEQAVEQLGPGSDPRGEGGQGVTLGGKGAREFGPADKAAYAQWVSGQRRRDTGRLCALCGGVMVDALATARYHPPCRRIAAKRRYNERRRQAKGLPPSVTTAPEPPDIVIG